MATLLWRFAGQPASSPAYQFADGAEIAACAEVPACWLKVTDVTSRRPGLLQTLVLTFGLVSVIPGTASGAKSVGVDAYIALAGLWASPLSGASMNPIRSLAPDLVAND